MGKSRDRANRSGSDPVNIGTSRLSVDSGNVKVTAQDGTTFKKIFAEEVQVGSGNNRVIFKRGSDGKAQFQSTTDGGGSTSNLTVGGSSTVTNPSDLPITGNQAGDTVLVTSTNNLMIYNGSGWYKIATITNANPTISSAGNASYTFATDGTPVSIEIVASDPEGIALQYKYQITTGSLGSTATVTNSATSGGTYSALAANTLSNNRFFKVTPSTNQAHAGVFAITFSVTDGVNTANSNTSSFTLAFDVSSSFVFDGTGDYVSTPDNDDWHFGTGDFTLEAYIYAYSFPSYMGIIAQWPVQGSNSNNSFALETVGANPAGLDFYSVSGTSITSHQGTIALSTNTWYHVVVQRSSGTIKSFVNGIQDISGSNSTNFNNSTYNLTLGGDVANGGSFDGYISNARIVKGSAVYSPTALSGFSGSIYLNGGSVSTSSSSDFTMGTGDFTIETWFKYTGPSALSSNHYLFDLGTSNDIRVTFGGGKLNVDDGSVVFSGNVNAIDNSRWYHLAYTRTGGNSFLYLDGDLIGSLGNSNYNHTQNTFTLGNYGGGGNYKWTGYISDFRIVKGKAVYTGNFTRPTGPLTTTGGTYPSNTNISNPTASQTVLLLGNNASSITDVSDTPHTMSASGSASANSAVPTGGSIIVPDSDLTAITNTKLLTFTEKDGSDITAGSTRFDGTNDKLVISSTNIINSLANFTVEAWAFFDIENPSDEQNLVEFNTGTRIIFGRRKNASGITAMYIYSAATSDLYTDDAAHDINHNRWIHLAWVKEGQNFRMYIDGKNVKGNNNNSATNMAATPSASLITIGMNSDGNERMDGYISNLRISSTARYSADFNRPTAAFTNDSDTILLTCQNSTGSITDASSNNYTIVEHSGVSANTYNVPRLPIDASSSSHVLSAVGDTKFSHASPFAQGSGGSVLFDGTDDYLTVTSSSDFALGTGNFTIECWVYFTDTSLESSVNRRIFCLDDGGNAVDNLQIVVDNGGYTTDGSLFLYSNGFKGNLSTNIKNGWHHIAVVRNSGTLKFYLDGVEKDSNSNTQDYSPNSGSPTPVIGTRGDNTGDYNGYISNLRIVKGTAVYTSNFTVPTSKLTAVTNTILLTCNDSNTIDDDSTSNRRITVNGNAIATTFTPF